MNLLIIIILGLIITLPILSFSYSVDSKDVELATFAGGCFWCMEPPYDKIDGVISVTSGYIGGKTANPTYEEVSTGETEHAEAVQIAYNPKKVTYGQLLDIFWHNIDPTTPNKQFCDVGTQYRSAIFYHNEGQKELAETSKQKLIESGKVGSIVTQIVKASTFYPAENYHQEYYKKNPIRYETYHWLSGRAQRLEELWGDKE